VARTRDGCRSLAALPSRIGLDSGERWIELRYVNWLR
jgi:hypothetical protein